MRQVCKNWKRVVDDFCSKPHLERFCKNWRYIPHVSIDLNLIDPWITLVQELGACNQNPFIGGRLEIYFEDTFVFEEAAAEARYNALVNLVAATGDVWQHVKHLSCTIQDFGGNFLEQYDRRRAVFVPWLSKMTNVVTFQCCSEYAEELMHCLAFPDKLESIEIDFNDREAQLESPYGWTRFLEHCCINLRRLVVRQMEENLQAAIFAENLHFPNLKEFGVFWWEIFRSLYAHEEETKEQAETRLREDERKTYQFLTLYVTPSRFPNLRKITIPLLFVGRHYGEWEDCIDGRDGKKIPKMPRFANELVDFSNRMSTLETICLNVSWSRTLKGDPRPTYQTYPIDVNLYGRGGHAVKKLLVSSGFNKNNTVWQWITSISKIFPNVKYLDANGEVKLFDGVEWTRQTDFPLLCCNNNCM